MFQIRTTSILEEYEIKQVSQYYCRHTVLWLEHTIVLM